MSDFNRELLLQLGKQTHSIKEKVYEKLVEGVDIEGILSFIEIEIFSKGYFPSFPAMISLNDMAAHYTIFDEGKVLKRGDVVKVDFGMSYNGFLTDTAFTVEIGTQNHKTLIDTARACLEQGVESMESGVELRKVGENVDSVAKKHGFNTIHNLSGHQIAQYNLHYGLSIPNYDNGDTTQIPLTCQFAIEPFVTYGDPKVKPVRPSNILQLVKYKPLRDPIAMKLLRHIKNTFPYLPFSKRWLVQELLDTSLKGQVPFKGFDKSKVLYGISILKKHGCIHEYDELGTVDGSIVAQFENCVVFIDGVKTVLMERF